MAVDYGERIADALEEIAKQTPDLWRVDIEGMPLYVRGEIGGKRLEKFNHKYSVMKLALYKIASCERYNQEDLVAVARDAIRLIRDTP